MPWAEVGGGDDRAELTPKAHTRIFSRRSATPPSRAPSTGGGVDKTVWARTTGSGNWSRQAPVRRQSSRKPAFRELLAGPAAGYNLGVRGQWPQIPWRLARHV
jgi:hypothetical protein